MWYHGMEMLIIKMCVFVDHHSSVWSYRRFVPHRLTWLTVVTDRTRGVDVLSSWVKRQIYLHARFSWLFYNPPRMLTRTQNVVNIKVGGQSSSYSVGGFIFLPSQLETVFFVPSVTERTGMSKSFALPTWILNQNNKCEIRRLKVVH